MLTWDRGKELRVIQNTDAGLLDRNVQSSKMINAALLLLMLEARNHGDLVFTISLKRSTKLFSYPQAAGRLPHHLGQKPTSGRHAAMSASCQ